MLTLRHDAGRDTFFKKRGTQDEKQGERTPHIIRNERVTVNGSKISAFKEYLL